MFPCQEVFMWKVQVHHLSKMSHQYMCLTLILLKTSTLVYCMITLIEIIHQNTSLDGCFNVIICQRWMSKPTEFEWKWNRKYQRHNVDHFFRSWWVQECAWRTAIWFHSCCITKTDSMVTSSNWNIFRVTGPLCVLTKAIDAELWCFP